MIHLGDGAQVQGEVLGGAPTREFHIIAPEALNPVCITKCTDAEEMTAVTSPLYRGEGPGEREFVHFVIHTFGGVAPR